MILLWCMKITVKKDGKGFLAKVQDKIIDTFAWGETKEEAMKELSLVVESIMDIRLNEVERAKKAKKLIRKHQLTYAV